MAFYIRSLFSKIEKNFFQNWHLKFEQKIFSKLAFYIRALPLSLSRMMDPPQSNKNSYRFDTI